MTTVVRIATDAATGVTQIDGCRAGSRIERLADLRIEQAGALDRLRAVALPDGVLRLDHPPSSFIGGHEEGQLLSVGQAARCHTEKSDGHPMDFLPRQPGRRPPDDIGRSVGSFKLFWRVMVTNASRGSSRRR